MTSRAIIVLILAPLLWLSACSRQPEAQPVRAASQRSPPIRFTDTAGASVGYVSYYKLLAKPEDYDGKPVQVMGVLSISNQDNVASLYPNTESFRYQVKMDELSLELTNEQWKRFATLDGRFVSIEGTFARITKMDEYAAAGRIAPVKRLGDFSEYHR